MISRLWHGWTTAGNADDCETLLRTEIFGAIKSRGIKGFRGIELWRSNHGDEVEFVTVMKFESLDAVMAFAGMDYEVAVVPPSAQALLSRYDGQSAHYEVVI